MSDVNCAALELCVCKDLPVTPTHRCPACHVCVHAFCGETCEEASIQYQTTCFKCFARYSSTFKDPEDFDAWKIQNPEEELTFVEDDNMHLLQSSANQQNSSQDITQLGLYKVALKDSALTKADKTKKRRDFIQKLTLSQCVVEFDGETSVLVSIAGIPHSKLLLNDLMLFCATHKISGYRQKKKDEVSLLIAARVASDNIYASIGRLGMERNDDSAVSSNSLHATAKKKSYRSKLVRPKAVTKTGSYFRAISLWFSPQNRHLVLATGKKMNRMELDVGGYRHKPIWENLAEQFNKNTGVPDGGDAEENAYLDVIQSPHILYDGESPEDFDQLDGQDVAQFIRWITHQYYVVHKSVSGDHALFEDRVGEKGYLLYFHNMITATGAENLESLMKAQLSHDVFSESSIDGATGIATPTPTKKRKSKGPPSSTKEKTDEAILRYILMDRDRDESRTTTSPGTTTTTSSRDEYIQVKKRIAVRADEVAMAREVSDAVDMNLQKWKDTLKHLQEMENDGIPANHPIFIATKATANMHESSFNASLAIATKAQTRSTNLDTPNAATLDVPIAERGFAVGAPKHDEEIDEPLSSCDDSCGSSTK